MAAVQDTMVVVPVQDLQCLHRVLREGFRLLLSADATAAVVACGTAGLPV